MPVLLSTLTVGPASAQGGWQEVPEMPTARYGLAGVSAPCPKDVPELKGTCVYAIGGSGSSDVPVDTVEAYSPTTNTWKTLPALPTARWGVAGTAAPCPKDVPELRGTCVYAIGGFTDPPASWPDSTFDVATVEAYSPATNTWKSLPEMPTARSFPAATTAPCPKDVQGLWGTCVYAIGGAFGDTAEVYSPTTNSWQTLPSMDAERDAPAASTAPCPKDVSELKGTCVYATGGFNPTDEVLDSVEAYSPVTNTWQTLPSMSIDRVAHAGAAAPCPKGIEGLRGVCVYAVGGFSFTDEDEILDSAEAYSPVTNSWQALPSLNTPRFESAGAAAPCPKDGYGSKRTCVYAIGGSDASPFNALNSVEAFAVGDGQQHDGYQH